MKYRIKNENVENAVRGLFKTQEAYEKALFETCAKQLHDPYHLMNMPISSKDSLTGVVSTIGLLKMDIEEVVEYNPRRWNPYPQVKPPKEGRYRIHYEVEDVGYVRRVIYWNGKEWETNCPLVERFAFGFKPWDDEALDDEESEE